MTIDPRYQDEYNDSLSRAEDTIQHLYDYFHNLHHAQDKTQYVRSDEERMLQVVHDVLQQYERSSQRYFQH
jgi:hypothetical protein